MTLDGFLTFLGLAAAVFAIIPPVARLRIRLQLGVQIALAAIAVTLALYFEFFEFVALPCPSILGGVCPLLQMPTDSKFTPEMAAFIVVLVWMVLAFFAATLLPPSQRSLGPMAELLERLFHQDRYGEAVDFLLPHLEFIDRAQNRGLWTQRTHDWLAGNRIVDVEALLAERKKANRLRESRRFLRPLAKLFPSGNHAQENAERILNSMYLTRQFMDYVALQRPSVAGMLVTLDAHQRYDFSNRLLHSLISVPGSRLYEELERNAKYDGMGDSLVVGHNFILRAYFGNARVAELLGAWKPVGDYLISEIRRADQARLNGRSDDFDKGRWNDPIAVGVAYFDLMIRSSSHRPIGAVGYPAFHN
ncbi:hypothetical protein [Sinorhizobium meliloti]|uniref:hypothetical protein n=1 Tax=Rhizobium meliloti TaxID=382 RepID=UPI000FD52978|nr:hypothetical protein [Sinorhizobium meliloti]RVL87331.1 hypothetical protein CN136_37925 [Sinorhizobium meliloti]RVN85942.1 hypothetical protein CN101_21670 [Sinorhizobium meliloti]RVO58302.1 hypothetical protein CN094_20455 [Sinorhizobium meliloti]